MLEKSQLPVVVGCSHLKKPAGSRDPEGCQQKKRLLQAGSGGRGQGRDQSSWQALPTRVVVSAP